MNVIRYYRTVRNLRPVQMVYQIRYRLFGFKIPVDRGEAPIITPTSILINALDMDERYIKRFHPDNILDDEIELLHDKIKWTPGRWQYSDRTHLFNFNLHYFEYGIALAVIYSKTKNEAYWQKLEELYRDWKKTCLGRKKSDAMHPYTTSLRMRNLLIIADILGDKKEIWLELITEDLFFQYRFLKHNQEKNLLGNHYFENLVTLYICSKLFDDTATEARTLISLKREIREQIMPDGMHFERSFMYHNLILEDLLRVYIISNDGFRDYLKPVISKMLDVAVNFEDNYRVPLFNDAGSNVAKTKEQLAIAAKKIVGYDANQIKKLNYAGYYILESKKFKVIMDAGNMSPKYISGHGHCDMLSFELFCEGEPFLVNSGTYQYQTKYRNYFRGTKANNTISAKDLEQSEIWGEHRTGRMARTVKRTVTDTHINAEIKDYLGNDIRRSLSIGESVEISDHLPEHFLSNWHVHPYVHVDTISDHELCLSAPNGSKISMRALDGRFMNFDEDSMYSEEFGILLRNTSFQSNANHICIAYDG